MSDADRDVPIAGADSDILVKLILVGDSGVGKTNLISRFVKNQFHMDSKTTIGVEFGTKAVQVQGKTVHVQVWDTAGQERYRAIASSYYRGTMGAVVVFDICSSVSFTSVDRWLTEIKDQAGNIPILMCGNKSDLAEQRSVDQAQATNFAEREHLLYFETSACDATNVQESFVALISSIIAAEMTPGGESKLDLSVPRPGVAVVT
jgi:small GTP-binding protein